MFVISGRIHTRSYDYDIKGDALRPKTAKQAVLTLVADAGLSKSEAEDVILHAARVGEDAIFAENGSSFNIRAVSRNPRNNLFGFGNRLKSLDGVKFVLTGEHHTRPGYYYVLKGDAVTPRTAAEAANDLAHYTGMSKSEAVDAILHASRVGEDAIFAENGSSINIRVSGARRSNPRANLFGLFTSRLDALKGMRFHVGGKDSDKKGALPVRMHAVPARTAMLVVEELVGLGQRDAEDVVLEAAKFGRATADNALSGGVVAVVLAD